ncbi:MAG: transcription-repair coupling factor [Gammaproteobacteria bacterium]|nr:transcription-repair coupling factor [Gammaproteobacteria bacterium]
MAAAPDPATEGASVLSLERVTQALPAGTGVIDWRGLAGSARALALALAARTRPLAIITGTPIEADRLAAELRFFAGAGLPILFFPGNETLAYDPFSPHPDITSQRLATLASLPALTRGIVVASLDAVIGRLPPAAYVASHTLLLETGMRLDAVAFRERLVAAGYVHVPQVATHGEFALRGSIIDLYPMGAAHPYRLDLFDDCLDSIRAFDAETQRSGERMPGVRLLPAREFPLDAEGIRLFRRRWRARFEGDPSRSPVYRAVGEGRAPAGVEAWLPLFFERTDSFFDYLPPGVCLADASTDPAAAAALWTGIGERHEDLRHDLERPLLRPGELFIEPEELAALLVRRPRIVLPPSPASTPAVTAGTTGVDFNARPAPDVRIDRRAADPAAALRRFLGTFQGRVLITADSAGRRELLVEELRRDSLEPQVVGGWQAFRDSPARLAITVGADLAGMLLPADGLALLADSQLAGERARQERRRRRAEHDPEVLLRDLTALAPGAPVVHEDHGIGRYLGLKAMDVEGHAAEFLVIAYEGGDKLYVPVLTLERVVRYTGGPPESAPLHRLGGDQWAKARHRAAQRVRDVAAELLDLYARRAAREGVALDLREAEYETFAAQFPFEETPDQADAIHAVLADLRSGKPMDRVVCGDVGFGKTEVALRAAFAAVQGGRQVALLVPTTLLAQQHYQTFADRLADWPVRVESLSRFRSAKEQAAILDALARGGIDIVIGTHRLLQKDVRFRELGLVIIDEEHRFGVRDKERLKSLRANVDVLTLTATPIPRTLNMAMGGLRDLSLITTPPAERVAVATFVTEWSDGLLREACLRELRRGGQVYFVHNVVETIEKAAARLTALVPDARIRVGHGQMRERELEQLMLDFYHRRFDILVCTTIIESGIDVPTANTIIVDRADRFGLAQLHQLRGRVGRSHHRAFAYLVTPPRAALNADAVKRLEAIESLEDLGAGFMLATHDLEIRGAGELLGDEQTGQIHEVGMSLYLELLDRAVKSLRAGREPDPDAPFDRGTEVDLHLPALLPEDYIADVHQRLKLYRRIAGAADRAVLDELQVELVDRFGPLPPAGHTLFAASALKLRAAALGIARLDVGPGAGLVQFAADSRVDPARLIKLVQRDRRYRLDGGQKLRFAIAAADEAARLKLAGAVLDALT